MSGSHFSLRNDTRQASLLVDEVVNHFVNRGNTRERAVVMAARALGLTDRKAKKLLYGEICAVVADEYREMRRRFLEHLDDEARHLAERHIAVWARRRQMEMDL